MNIGVIGVGRVGSNHARICTKLRDAYLVGYCDIDKEKVDKLAMRYNVKAFYDYKKMIRNVDAVIISTQTIYHYEIAKYCLENGKHVLVEKPITLDLKEGQELINIAKNKNVVFTVGHVERFNSAVEILKEIFNPNDTIGISIKRMSPMDHRVKDIDVILDLMIHDIDIVLNLMKNAKIIDVKAMGNIVREESLRVNHCDYALSQIQFDNNVIVDLTASRVTDRKIRKLFVNSREKFIELDYMNKGIKIFRNFKAEINSSVYDNLKYQEESIVQQVYVNNNETLYDEDQNFVDAIIGKNKLKVLPQEALNALKIANKIQNQIYNKKFKDDGESYVY